MTADVEKAFQIIILEEDRDIHQFMWQPDVGVMFVRFTHVPFVNYCSPFLLHATLQQHHFSSRLQHLMPTRCKIICTLMIFSGTDSEAEGCALIQDSTSILDQARMSLNKWCSSSSTVADLLVHGFENKFLTAD